MKKLLIVFMVFALAGCTKEVEEHDDIMPTQVGDLGVFYMEHLSGPRVETTRPVIVLFEYDLIGYTKYQITYLSCGCRATEDCYQQVTYVELTDDGTVQFISYDKDSNGHYTAAMWGDSDPTPLGKTKEDFRDEYFPFFIGKSPEELTVYNSIDDLTDWEYVDSYAGSSVSVNNILRAIQGLQEYHLNREK